MVSRPSTQQGTPGGALSVCRSGVVGVALGGRAELNETQYLLASVERKT